MAKIYINPYVNNLIITLVVLSSTVPISVDPCSHMQCGQGAQCVKKISKEKTDKLVECKCIDAVNYCLEAIHVCASDNTTHKSHCHMDAAACASRKRLTVLHYGDCRFGKCIKCCDIYA